jgi:pimeloyl-ACP methyl ester carboxylesterase
MPDEPNASTPLDAPGAKTGTPRIVERGVVVNGLRLVAAMNDDQRGLLPRVPLIVLPEIGFVWRDYAPLLERFAGERRVFALDWPGFGASATPGAGYAYTVASYVETLAGWLDGLGIARGVLVANGVAGAVALRYAAAHPRRVLGLALLAPVGFSTGALSSRLVSRMAGNAALSTLIEPLATSLALGPDSAAEVRAATARHRALRIAGGYHASLAARSALWRDATSAQAQASLAALAKGIELPTIVMRGALDPLVTGPEAHRAAESLGGHGALEVTLPEAGHLPFLQQPQRCYAALDGVLGTAELAAAQMS